MNKNILTALVAYIALSPLHTIAETPLNNVVFPEEKKPHKPWEHPYLVPNIFINTTYQPATGNIIVSFTSDYSNVHIYILKGGTLLFDMGDINVSANSYIPFCIAGMEEGNYSIIVYQDKNCIYNEYLYVQL